MDMTQSLYSMEHPRGTFLSQYFSTNQILVPGTTLVANNLHYTHLE